MIANGYFENYGPISPFEKTKVLDMAMNENQIPCDVFFATMESGNTFSSVIMYPGTQQRGYWMLASKIVKGSP